jgi:hypothetical protein
MSPSVGTAAEILTVKQLIANTIAAKAAIHLLEDISHTFSRDNFSSPKAKS